MGFLAYPPTFFLLRYMKLFSPRKSKKKIINKNMKKLEKNNGYYNALIHCVVQTKMLFLLPIWILPWNISYMNCICNISSGQKKINSFCQISV